MLNHFWWPQMPVPHASLGFQLLGTQCSRFTSTLPSSGDAEPHSKLIICMPCLAPAPVSTPLTCYGEIHPQLTRGQKGQARPCVDHAITSATSLLPRNPEANHQPVFGSTVAKAQRAQSAMWTCGDANPPTRPMPCILLPMLQPPTFDAFSISASPWGGEPQAQHFWFPLPQAGEPQGCVPMSLASSSAPTALRTTDYLTSSQTLCPCWKHQRAEFSSCRGQTWPFLPASLHLLPRN